MNNIISYKQKLPKTIIAILLIFFSCEDTTEDKLEIAEDVISLELNPRLDQDENGFYHLELEQGSWQTIHRLSGHAYLNDEPLEVLKVFWEASHFWYIGDTLGYIIRRGLTDDLQYVSYDTSYVTWFDGFEVPVVNSASYSNAEGEVNTMFAPVRTMLGDTITIWYSWSGWYAGVSHDSLKIILE